MLGRHHFTLSIATVAAVIVPFASVAEIPVLISLLGVAIGSLIPDVDAADAAIFHTNVSGLRGQFGDIVNRLIGPLLPVFGYTTKYLIFMPAVLVFDLLSDSYSFSGDHRSFTHSLLGVATMTTVTGLYLLFILSGLNMMNLPFLVIFLSGYAVGALLHMLEDSTTKTGIKWNSPFSDFRLSGAISTGEDNAKPRLMSYLLGGTTVATFYTATSSTAPVFRSSLAGLVTVTVLWLMFLSAVDVRSSS